MSYEWTETTLGDVSEWTSGGTPKKDVSEYWNGSIPWISASSMHSSRYSESDLKVTELGLKKGTRLALKETVLLLVRGSALHERIPVGIAMRDVAFNQDVKAIVAKQDLIRPWYLLYWLIGHDKFMLDSVVEFTGIGAGKLDTKRMQSLPVFLPSLNEQDQIVEVVKSIDDQIELFRETNKTIEAIAQAIFKSWFIDFDPVKKKSEGLVPSGIDEDTAALFPDSFDGLIPAGWSTNSLDQIATYLNGLALQKFPPSGSDDLPVIKIAQLRKGDTKGADLANSTLKPEYIVQDGDVLFSWSGTLEVEIWCGGKGALNQHLFKVTSETFAKWFYFLWTRYHLENFRQIAAGKATTMGHIQRAHLTDAKVCVPSKSVLEAADAIFEPLIESIILNSQEIKTLTDLRDALLPRLISGKLTITEIKETAETV